MNPTLVSTLSNCARQLEAAGADAPRLCAELLLAKALGLERQELLRRVLLEPESALDAQSLERLNGYAARRAAGEPAAYILGKKEFYGRDFLVNPAVLIPRPETELIIDLARQFAVTAAVPPRPQACGVFADLGAGSGCIGVTLALEMPAWRGLCLEKSAPAAQTALANARGLGAAGLTVIRGDFAAAPLPDACLDLVAANPPYVGEKEYARLAPEVRREPKSALVPQNSGAAATGLEDPARVTAEAARLLKSGGLLLMEIGSGQGPALLAALDETRWTGASIVPDLAGLDRVLRARRR